VLECHKKQQPVLVGTVSIEKSERLNDYLVKEGIKASILNAKHHEQEAYIIAQAGVPGSITIATNMAGRGTDIQLGGNLEMRVRQETAGIEDAALLEKKVKEIKKDVEAKKKIALAAGGLYVIGTERHESRRIDNQLRGRTGRQGDPGESKFFLSMDDDLMRIFGGERMKSMLSRLGLKSGEAITHSWVSKALEKAQTKVETHNFSIRKNLLKYDDVMNDQRKIIYAQRYQLMSSDNVHGHIEDMRFDVMEDIVARAIPERSASDDWNLDGLEVDCLETLSVGIDVKKWIGEASDISEQTVFERIKDASDNRMQEQEDKYGGDFMRFVEKSVMLQTLDQVWKDNLLQLDYLKKGIGLRAYAQKDPLNEYKKEAFVIFEDNILKMKYKTIRTLAGTDFTRQGVEELTEEGPMETVESQERLDAFGTNAEAGLELAPKREIPGRPPAGADASFAPTGFVDAKISRNAPCPCGSGKKYKHCHGRLK
jgi:preprotein translocase subunit SecA